MAQKVPLTSVSVSYSPAQDRLLLKATNATGEVVHLWMTQRLMRLVRPHVEKWLNATIANEDASKADKKSQPGQPKPSSKAVAQKQEPPGQELLVTNVDLGTSDDKVNFLFRGADPSQDQYFLRLSGEQLDRWWSGVMQTCDLGAWSTDATPPHLTNVKDSGVTLH